MTDPALVINQDIILLAEGAIIVANMATMQEAAQDQKEVEAEAIVTEDIQGDIEEVQTIPAEEEEIQAQAAPAIVLVVMILKEDIEESIAQAKAGIVGAEVEAEAREEIEVVVKAEILQKIADKMRKGVVATL